MRKLLLPLLVLVSAAIALGSGGTSTSAQQPTPRVPVLIGFTHQPGPAQEALVRGVGGTTKYTYHLVPAIAATVPEAAIAGLQANPNVTSVDLDGEVRAIDAELDNSWGVKRIGAGTVHDGENRGTGVKVAVIDSGIDYTHPDLDANYAGGYDFVNVDTDPMDDYGHGTHVAGTACAEDDDSGVVGVAPECALYALKVLDAGGYGYSSDIIAALQRAVDDGAQVANLSLGSSRDPGSTVQAAFDNAEAAGLLIVAAAGNSGNPAGRGNNVEYPARYDSVIAVAATDSSDNRASFSSTGDQVELAAPGVNVNSTWLTWLEDGYHVGNGTSMASPHVAGTAALVIASGVTSNVEVRQILQDTADDLGATGRDPQYGFGLVDAAEAVTPPGPPNDPPTVFITSPADGSTFDSGVTILFEGTASDTEDGDLTATLVWTSSMDGQIGTGGSFSATLSDATHTITASVTDSGGKIGSASVGITVGTPPSEPTTVSVSSITYATEGGRYGDRHLLITVALVDDLDNPVDGASVSVDVSLDDSPYGSRTGTTGADGSVTFKEISAPSGCYTTIVTSVAAEGLEWDSVTPDNGYCKE